MKNLFFTLFFFGIVAPTFCQSWNVIPTDNINNYRTPSGELIQQSVWLDSLTENGESLIFHFNKIAEINNDTMLINKNHFLSNQIRQYSDSLIFYYETDTLILLKNATLNEPWLADAENDSYYSIVREEEIDIFGITDSIKVFRRAESQDSLVLSKSFGVTEFSLPYDALSYTLAGVDNLDLGETVIGFEEIFDFTVGDVLFYREINCNYSGDFASCGTKYEKLTVLSVTHSENTVTVEYNYRIRSEEEFMGTTNTGYSNYTATEIYSKDDQPHWSSYPNQLVTLDSLDINSFCTSDSFYTVTSYYIDENGRKTKGIFNDVDSYPNYNFCALTSDTLLGELEFQDINYKAKEGLGLTHVGFHQQDVVNDRELVGYINDGIEYGVIYSDSFLTSIDDIQESPLRIYPNPTTDIINIESQDLIGSQLNISSVEGIVVQQFEITDNNLVKSIKDLPKGIYYISISRDAKAYHKPFKLVKY